MPLKMRVFTLNCGNGSLGEQASTELVSQLSSSQADLFILNCQEIHFDWAIQALRQMADKKGLIVRASPHMVTHTKFGTHFHNKTGMMTLILHKKEVKIEAIESTVTRRGPKRLSSAFNKGGIFSRIRISKTIAGKAALFTIDNVNAHLDAFHDAVRAQDWANVHRLHRRKVTSWDELKEAIPHLICSGYDANTRNRFYADGNKTINRCAWEAPYDEDMQSLMIAPLGNVRESQFSTYRSNDPDILSKPAQNRKNRSKGGMLDIVAYTDLDAVKKQLASANLPLVQPSEISISAESNGSRDHNVIGSRIVIIDERKNDFDRVREVIACSLAGVAPQLAAHVLSDDFADSPAQREYLLTVYQHYLSPQGLLQKYLQLHAQRLQYLQDFEKQETVRGRDAFCKQMFYSPQPWFASHETDGFNTKEGLIQLANNQNCLLTLMALQSKFLNEAVSEKESEVLCTIVNKTLEKMPKNLALNEQQKWIKQTYQLLSVNKLLQEYDRHLTLEAGEGNVKPLGDIDPLLTHKKQKIADLESALLADTDPEQVITDLQTQLEQIKETLAEHRHNDFWSVLYRKLKEILTGASLARGGFFVVDVKKQIQSEDKSVAIMPFPVSVGRPE
ncbi:MULTISPECIES: hypothetical protein [Legionella]|uniref:Uncharacterized protein n=1 Tax=Legionella maceachernii TaxID=466 RepID=A0A0W0VVF1_9GAMM|nr:hypothetical protein [Legionella maceachernii]KTD24047.1 hypothetical protein Lmac_2920 [Legionella maceachernii]SJZ84836.1 hypothetical protein SAMN02745128_01214 [Legionella maceachernii]SUO99272.1 Uncharacterised protein [Legionella maceachernii]